jgi:NAD(P)-dependent dehydrogenase (short-subunit alcohol dehydrogenase family)
MLDGSRFSFAGRRALVTGAGAGIGEAIALGLASFGADVAVLDKDADGARRSAERVRALGRRAEALVADVCLPRALEAALEQATRALGELDVLVNNAGAAAHKPVIDFDDAEWDHELRLNLGSAFVASRWLARRWIAAKRGGAIVNVATTEGIRGCPGFGPYSAAKAGMINLTKTLSSELGPYGIRVNAVAPDYTPTRGAMEHDLEGRTSGALMERVARMIPLRRIGTPDDSAGAVLFLASDLAAWISGQTLVVDGGALACARVEGPLPFPRLDR